MYPRWHILFGVIFSLIVYFVFEVTLFNAVIVFLASFLIDFDHYTFYVRRKKDYSLKNAYLWYMELPKSHKPMMHIFHTLEFLIFVAVLSYFFSFFSFVLVGMLFHSIFDIADMFYKNELQVREFSFIRFLILSRKNPDKYF